MGVVFHHPVNRIAGQSVLAPQRGDAAVFQPAQPAFGGGPERSVGVELKVADAALAQPVGGSVRCADLTIGEIGDSTLQKSKPQAALQTISYQSGGEVLDVPAWPRESVGPRFHGDN